MSERDSERDPAKPAAPGAAPAPGGPPDGERPPGSKEPPPLFATGPYPGPVPPEIRDAMIGAVAQRVVSMGMSVPAIFFLEGSKPLSYIGSQVMVFFGPFVQSLFAMSRYYEFAALMEDRANVERLLLEIEKREDERATKEREEKKRRKAERAASGKPGFFVRMQRRLFPVVLLAAGAALAGVAGSRAQDAATAASAPAGAPPTDIRAADTPDDAGHSITVEWSRSADDGAGARSVIQYIIYRATAPDGPWERVGRANAGGATRTASYTDATVENGVDYWYRVVAARDSAGASAREAAREAAASTLRPARASGQWFNRRRANMLGAVLVLSAAVLFYVARATRGARVYLRPVAGLRAFEDGVGRATELGRKVLYVPGVSDLDHVETVASVIILGHVARMTASYETPLEVPVSRSLVMATAREVTQQAYLAAGRPDLYDPEMVHYLTDEQFAYAAAVSGIITRERPATIFYQGRFLAESLILAETGNSIGAIQIAGTASPAQLPFFVTACDYTLIGEELFAASAYLSQDPKLMGSIKGQDFGKILFMVAIACGVVLESLAALGVGPFSISRFFAVR